MMYGILLLQGKNPESLFLNLKQLFGHYLLVGRAVAYEDAVSHLMRWAAENMFFHESNPAQTNIMVLPDTK
jgi:hypothetical protein